MQHPNQEGTLAAGGAPQAAQDSQYDHMAPWANPGPSEYNSPDGSWESRAIRQATVTVVLPRKQVQRLVAPPLPQIGPRGVRHSQALSVEDIFADTARLYPDNRTFFSGSPAGYSGTPRNEWGSNFG